MSPTTSVGHCSYALLRRLRQAEVHYPLPEGLRRLTPANRAETTHSTHTTFGMITYDDSG